MSIAMSEIPVNVPIDKRTIRNKLNVTRDRLADERTRKLLLENKNGEFDKELDSLNKISKDVSRAREGVLDAESLTILAEVNLDSAKQLNESKFFAVRDLADTLHARFVNADGSFDWVGLGRASGVFFKNVPRIEFMLGPITLRKNEKKKKRAKKKKTVEEHHEVTRPDETTTADEVAEKVTATRIDEVKRIFEAKLESLKTYKQERGTLPNNYESDSDDEDIKKMDLYHLLLNPESYSQTVENLFYYAFLVKNNFCGVKLGSDGLPKAALELGTLMERPETLATQADQGDESEERPRKRARTKRQKPKQFILSLDYDQWKKLKESYQLKEPVIPTRTVDEKKGPGQEGIASSKKRRSKSKGKGKKRS
eukprot:g2395.t1